jgi:RNA polymerase sigma factor (sigma-70 family)
VADSRLSGFIQHLRAGLASSSDRSDRESLTAFLDNKDEAAFELLMRRHGPMVLRVCQRVLNNAQDSEDAFQATFLILARKANTIGKSESLASWLHGVAYRISLHARRSQQRRRQHEQSAGVVEPITHPAEDLGWHDVQLLLEKEIARLPDRYREVFVLCFLQGRSRSEAAFECGLNENTVSSRLARARERLQQRLAQRGISLSAVLAALALASDSPGSVVSKNLYVETSRAAVPYMARQSLTGVSPFTVELTKEAVRTMTIAKLQFLAGTLAITGTLALSTWGLSQVPGGAGQETVPGGIASTTQATQEAPLAKPREASFAQRKISMNHLKQLMLAMHNYHDATGKFPSDVVGKDGKPLLSWRVEILPYIEEAPLYNQFKRDESWDSEHNLKLLAKMPELLRVGFEPKGTSHTYYQRFAIKTPAPKGPVGAPALEATFRFPEKIAEITDGTSNTIGIVEVGPGVPWTKPTDIQYDAKAPFPAVEWPFANVRHVSAMDGSAHALQAKLDEKSLRLLIEPSDGQVVQGFSELRARFEGDIEEEKKAMVALQKENQILIEALQKQIAEHLALQKLNNKVIRRGQELEELHSRLQQMTQSMADMNKHLRQQLGLHPSAAIPEDPFAPPAKR